MILKIEVKFNVGDIAFKIVDETRIEEIIITQIGYRLTNSSVKITYFYDYVNGRCTGNTNETNNLLESKEAAKLEMIKRIGIL